MYLYARLQTSPPPEALKAFLLDLEENWRPFIESRTEKQEQLTIAQRLTWCALHSREFKTRAAFDVSSDKPDFICKDEEDSWRFILAFRSGEKLQIPFACVVDTDGAICHFELKLCRGGTGNVYHHPDNPFRITSCEKDNLIEDNFIDAVETAWRAARRHVDNCNVDGCWRIIDPPAKPLGGPSAGGAAALGWLHLLRGTKPDTRVIVIAAIDTGGKLQKVGGVEAKTRAVAAANARNKDSVHSFFDKIIVAAPENRDAAVKDEAIVPEIVGSLADCADVRSQAATDLIHYLNKLIEDLDAVQGRNPARRSRDIAIDTSVYTRKIEAKDETFDPNDPRRRQHRSVLEEMEYQKYELPIERERRLKEPWSDVFERAREPLVLKGAPGSGKTFLSRQSVLKIALQARGALAAGAGLKDVGLLPIWITANELIQSASVPDCILESIRCNKVKGKLSQAFLQWFEESRICIVIDALDEISETKSVLREKLRALNAWIGKGRLMMTCRTMDWLKFQDNLGSMMLTEVELATLDDDEKQQLVRKFFARDSEKCERMLNLLDDNRSLDYACESPLLLNFACSLCDDPDTKIDKNTTSVGLYIKIMDHIFSGKWRNVEPFWGDEDEDIRDWQNKLHCIAWPMFSNTQEAKYNENDNDAKWREKNRFSNIEWKAACKQAGINDRNNRFFKELKKVGVLVSSGRRDNQDKDPCTSFLHRTLFEYSAARGLALDKNNYRTWIAEKAKKRPGEPGGVFWFAPEWWEMLTFLSGIENIDVQLLLDAVDQNCDDVFHSMLYLKAKFVGAADGTNHLSGSTLPIICSVIQMVVVQDSTISTLHRSVIRSIINQLSLTHQVKEQLGITLLDSLNPQSGPVLNDFICKMLGDIRSERTVNPLIQIMRLYSKSIAKLKRGEHAYLADFASQALVRIRSEGAVYGILQSLKGTEHWSLQIYAASALGRMVGFIKYAAGKDNIKKVPDLLKTMRETEYAELAQIVAEKLGDMRSARAVSVCLQALRQNEDLSLRSAVYWALDWISWALTASKSEHPDPKAFRRPDEPQIVTEVPDNIRIEQTVFELLKTIREAKNWDLRERAVEALIESSREAVSDEVFDEIAGALGSIKSEHTIKALVNALRDTHKDVRWVAAEALGIIKSERTVDALITALRDIDEDVRSSAASALGKINTEHAINALVTALWDPDEDIRLTAVRGLGDANCERAVDALVEVLVDENRDIRANAASSLGRLKSERTVDALITTLSDIDVGVRLSSVDALGKIKSKRTIEALVELFRDEDHGVRTHAADALWNISWEHKVPIFK